MIALDIETSGVNPVENSILSIGAVDTDDPTNQFYDECRIWDGAHVNDESLKINGFTHEEINDPAKKTEAEIIAAFFTWALDRPLNHTIVGQNSSFDRDFLEAAAARAHVQFPLSKRLLDTHTLCWLHMMMHDKLPPTEQRRSGLNTTAVLAYCGLPEEPKPHNALTGAFVHAEIFSRIAYNQKMLPEFIAHEIPWVHIKI